MQKLALAASVSTVKQSRKGSFSAVGVLPQQRLLALWAWLPAFRATADTGSLAGAAGVLGVSPSAVSRALRALETEIGATLFVRHEGLRLRLNPLGERLAMHVKQAMRLVDDGLRDGARRRVAVPAGVALPLSPELDIALAYVDVAEAVRRLEVGAVDAVFVVGVFAVPDGVEVRSAAIETGWWTRRAVNRSLAGVTEAPAPNAATTRTAKKLAKKSARTLAKKTAAEPPPF